MTWFKYIYNNILIFGCLMWLNSVLSGNYSTALIISIFAIVCGNIFYLFADLMRDKYPKKVDDDYGKN